MEKLDRYILYNYERAISNFACLNHIKRQLFNEGYVFTDSELMLAFKKLRYKVLIRFIPGSKEPISYWVSCFMPRWGGDDDMA